MRAATSPYYVESSISGELTPASSRPASHRASASAAAVPERRVKTINRLMSAAAAAAGGGGGPVCRHSLRSLQTAHRAVNN